jgi:hypothetical protein
MWEFDEMLRLQGRVYARLATQGQVYGFEFSRSYKGASECMPLTYNLAALVAEACEANLNFRGFSACSLVDTLCCRKFYLYNLFKLCKGMHC